MLNTIQWFVNLAFQVVAVLVGVELFICIIRPKTRRKLVNAIDEIAKTTYNWVHNKMSKKEEEPEKEEEVEEPKYEIHLTAKQIEAFNEMMKNQTPTL